MRGRVSVSRKCNLIRLFTIHREHMGSKNNVSKNVDIYQITVHLFNRIILDSYKCACVSSHTVLFIL